MDIRYWVHLLDRFDMTRAPVVRDLEVLGMVSLIHWVVKAGALVPLSLIMQS